MKKLIFAALGLFVFLTPCIARAQLTIVSDSTAPNSYSIVSLINSERTSRGLPALKINSKLTQAAEGRAALLASEGVLVHVSAPSGTPWPTLKAVGYEYSLAGENLASVPPATSEVVPAWMNSSAHRANVLNKQFEEVGIGVAMGPYKGGMAYYIVGYFADPKDLAVEAKTVSSNNLVKEINNHHILLAKALTTEQKIPIMIKLIGLLQTYLGIVQGRA